MFCDYCMLLIELEAQINTELMSLEWVATVNSMSVLPNQCKMVGTQQ